MIAKHPLTAEKKALWFSLAGMAVMAVAGIGFALVSHSEAILLDGVFSTISMILSMLTLKVAEVVRRPDDEHFHFGYAHFSPLLNLIKALVMVGLCIFALLSAINAVLEGGREMALGLAVVYGVIATLACLVIAVIMQKATARSNSVLVHVDAASWKVDTLISSAVLIGFVIGYLVRGTGFEQYLPDLDPAIVTVLVIIALPVPLKILTTSLREVLMMAPPKDYQDQVQDKIARSLSGYPIENYRVRLLKMGDTINVLVHARPAADFVFRSWPAMDEIRARLNEELAELPERAIVDLVFVGDMAFAD